LGGTQREKNIGCDGGVLKRNHILLVVSLGVLALGLWGFSLIPWVEGIVHFEPVDKHARPFSTEPYYPRDIFVKEQYQKLHIKEMSYEWEGNTGIFLKDKSWDSLYTKNEKRTYNFYDSLTGEYTYRLFEIEQYISEDVDFNKLFKGKKRGDVFRYTVTVVYSLDDEPESTQILEYNVEVLLGRYMATLLAAIFRIIGPLFA
jgi:hypothetical protein